MTIPYNFKGILAKLGKPCQAPMAKQSKNR